MQDKKLENSQCKFFPLCGGCSILNVSQDEYKNLKMQNLKKNLLLIKDKFNDDKISFFSINKNTRRKIILQVSKENKIGFFARGSKNLVEIDSCYVSQKNISDLIIELKNFCKDFAKNLITQISITAFDNAIDVVFICKENFTLTQEKKVINLAKLLKINASHMVKNIVTPIFLIEKNQIFYKNFSIDLPSNIFIQATKEGSDKIINIISNYIKNKFQNKIFIADIYSGFGSYSFAIIEFAKEIHAFEGSEEMTKSMKNNVLKNAFNNEVKIFNRDLFLFPIAERELIQYDLAIINPPRNGAYWQIIKIANSKLNHLIYVSCNAKSFASDAKILLDKGFAMLELYAIDQFYGSSHIEIVAIFERK